MIPSEQSGTYSRDHRCHESTSKWRAVSAWLASSGKKQTPERIATRPNCSTPKRTRMSESSGNRSHGQGSGDGGGGGGFGPVLSSTPSSICSPGSDLHTQVSNRADNNRIVVTFTNYGYLDLAYNFVAHLEKCSVSNYICVALDDKAYDALKSKNIPTYLLEMEKKLFNEDSHNFGTLSSCYCLLCNPPCPSSKRIMW
jgi:hypothetical protein